MLDYEAFRAEQAEAREPRVATSASASSNYVEPSTPGYGVYATEAATIRIEPSGTVNVYIAGGSTGNSLETTVVQLAADALGVRHRGRRHDPGRHRRRPASAPARRQPERVDDRGRGRARRRRSSASASSPIAAHKLEAAVGRHRARRQPGERARHAVDRHLARGARRARVLPARRAAAGDPGRARGERAVHRRRARRSG